MTTATLPEIVRRTITEDLTGMVVPWEYDHDGFDADATVDDIFDRGFGAFEEPTLLSLPPSEVEAIGDRASDLSNVDIRLAVELAARIDTWDPFDHNAYPDLAWDALMAWKRLRTECNREWRERHDTGFEPNPMLCYESMNCTEGVPEADGALATRLLPGWTVEMLLVEPDAGYNAEHKTVAATVGDWFEISDVKPLGGGGTLYNALAWELKGLEDHEDERFAIAPVEVGDDLTFWQWNTINEQWENPHGAAALRTWPNTRSWERDSNK